MKKLLFIAAFALFGTMTQAQIDVSVNPLGIIFGNYGAAVEFGMSEDIGIEVTPKLTLRTYDLGVTEYKSSGFGIDVIGKYYFSPESGLDKWNVGPYVNFSTSSESATDIVDVSNTRLSIGFYGGYKYVSSKNIIFEVGFGFGKALINKYSSDDETIVLTNFPGFNWDTLGKLAVGYRFGDADSSGSSSMDDESKDVKKAKKKRKRRRRR